ncbi:hypothetical protein RAC89_09715 [Paenibacillus sp. GD4]|uniref:hypothetical protein n=1 Tax=Paenibacillus sp. GD4 TaxID=3068890 RepID=UPI0027967924|nr:hypothetical protein [Paenibacillus sp. GD4]MDQ1910750.1 hypothetical protein [Paenibacillus sp. GD4]
MSIWPEELLRFVHRQVPFFIHVSAAWHEVPPFLCRGYGVRLHSEEELKLIWVSILHSQWKRLSEARPHPGPLSVLMTAGTDNESYQLKGAFRRQQSLTMEDFEVLELQRQRIAAYFPNLTPLVSFEASQCVAVELQVSKVYLQTPGPNAGALLGERR